MQFEERYDVEKLRFLKTLDQNTYSKLIHKEESKKADIKANYEMFKKFVKESLENNGKLRPMYSQNDFRGRYYTRSSSIQQLSKYIRGFLCADISTDIDIKNCYPVILKYICDKNKILCPDLTYYVEHRDLILNNYKNEKDDIKTQIFTIMFGGKVISKNDFVVKFKKEYAYIQKQLSSIPDYKNYYESFEKDKSNKQGASTFRIIEDIEIKIVSKAIEFFKNNNYEILAYMYDGVMIYGDHYLNSELLKKLNAEINKFFKDLKVEFVYKQHNNEIKQAFDNYEPNKEEIFDAQDDYESVKESFEKFCAKVIDKALYIVEKYENDMVHGITTFTESKLNISYKHLHYTMQDKEGKPRRFQFLPIWQKDENMRLYNDIDVYPTGIAVPKGNYNLWTNFEAEFMTEFNENKEGLEIMLNHIKIICGRDENIFNYFLKWIAYIIQYPSKKTICPVFVSKEGAGKGTMFELFRKMLGSKKIMETTSPERDVWGDFNGLMMDSYLVCINELAKKQQSDSVGKIKGLITDYEMMINQKGQPQIKIKSYHKFIITTNNEDPIYTDESDRRYFVIRSSDEKIGDMEYFTTINNLLDDKNVIKTCYEYFKNMPDIKNFPCLKKPTSSYHENLKELNKPITVLFLERMVELHNDKELVDFTATQLYEEFNKYIENNGIKYETNSFKLLCSIKNLNYDSITKIRTQIERKTRFNIKKLKKDLKMIDFVEEQTNIKDFI